MFKDMFSKKQEPFPEIPWIEIEKQEPPDGAEVIAKSPAGWWSERWDEYEGIGFTTHWKFIPDQETQNV